LKLKLSGGYTINTGHGEAFNNSKTRYGSIASTNRVNGSLSTGEQKAWLNENTLVYQTNIKDAHAISSVVGMSFQESINENFSMSAHHIPNESLVMAGLAQGTPGALGSSVSEWSMVSYFGRFNYNYLSKYYFTATFRADGSSKFAKGNQFGYFPSGSFAWTFTNERFMKSLEHVINSGKLRTSWGKTGNNRVGEYATYAVLDLGLNIVYPYNEIETNSGAYPSVLGNKKLKWETTTQTDIGLDLSFFNDRVGFTFDWYRKVTSDLLLRASLVPSSGFTFGTKNIGKVQNEGFEYTLNTQNIRTKNFKWSTDFNISFNTNTVLGLAENQQTLLTNASFGSSSPNYAARVGYPIGMMYGFIYEGIYTLDDFDYDGGNYTLKADIPRYVSDPNPRPGYPKHADLNNDGVIDSNDQTIIGRGDPLHIGGITNNFTYKGFDLSVFFQWSYGNDILCGNRISFENGNGVNTNKFASYSKRFILGDESTYNSNIPVASGANSNGLFSSRWIEDGSYIRLKTIMLGYTLPSRLLNKIGISRLHLFVSAQNLYTWTNYTGGYDPEVSVRNTALTPGVDYSAYPRALSFNTGLNMTF
jgi:TonB-linked SusC/RagA family outer membrane protein